MGFPLLKTNDTEEPRWSSATATTSIFSASPRFTTSTSSSDEDYVGFSSAKMDVVIRGLTSSDRLFFEPGTSTSSIMEETRIGDDISLKKRKFVLEMECDDPREDFKVSMAEMVAEHDLEDLDGLHEVLEWYLLVNEKRKHRLIVETFVNLLLELMSSSSASCCFNSQSNEQFF